MNLMADAGVLTALAGAVRTRSLRLYRGAADGAWSIKRQETSCELQVPRRTCYPVRTRDLGAPVDRDVTLPKGVKGGSAIKARASCTVGHAQERTKLQEGNGAWQRFGIRPGPSHRVRTRRGNERLAGGCASWPPSTDGASARGTGMKARTSREAPIVSEGKPLKEKAHGRSDTLVVSVGA